MEDTTNQTSEMTGKAVSLYLPIEDYQKLKIIAKSRRFYVSSYIRFLLAQHINNFMEERAKAKETQQAKNQTSVIRTGTMQNSRNEIG